MREQERRRLDAAGRLPMRSPGRPPVAGREERQRFWLAIAKGMPSEDAGIEAGVSPAVGTRWFRDSGGIRSVSLAPVSGRYLSFREREEIAVLHARGVGVREIARQLGRAASTVSRELRCNAATRGGCLEYRASTAQWHADRRARRPKAARLAVNEPLRRYVEDRLSGAVRRPEDGAWVEGPDVRWIGRRHGRRQDRRWATAWSPEQIANRLRADFPDDDSMRVSHEAIYQALYVQGRGALRRELTACLRTGRTLRVPRARTRGRGKGFARPEIMISERPAEAEDRAVPDHWEGDLILGPEQLRDRHPGRQAAWRVRLLRLAGRDGGGDRVPDGLRPVPGERGAVLGPGPAVAFHGRQVQQHREPRGALGQGADRGAVQPEAEVAFPVTGHGPVLRLGRPLADQISGRAKPFPRPLADPAPGGARPCCSDGPPGGRRRPGMRVTTGWSI